MTHKSMTREEFSFFIEKLNELFPQNMEGRELGLTFAAIAAGYEISPEGFDAILDYAREIYYAQPLNTGLEEPSK